MNLNDKLITEILAWCEENLNLDTWISTEDIHLSNYSSEQIKYTTVLLIEGGYIDSTGFQKGDYRSVKVSKLSMEGHMLLKSLSNPATGEKIGKFIKDYGLPTASFLLQLITSLGGLKITK